LELDIFIKVVFICMVGAMSPGPSWVLIINKSLSAGKMGGFLTSIGHGVGIALYALIANIGIGVILNTNIILFNGIKIFSIIFLMYLGYKSFQSKPVSLIEQKLNTGIKSFLEGLSFALLNPKVLIWFIAIYSQFMSPSNALIFNFILIAAAGIIDMGWYCLLVILVTSSSFIKLVQNKISLIQKLTGIIFISIGIFLLIEIVN